LNDLRLPRRSYDLVLFHQSLHHVSSIEKLLSRVGPALAEDGLLAMDEWTGPSRDEWDEGRLEPLRRLFAELPESWRRWPQLKAPIEYEDPSEAVCSSEILPAVRRLFHVIVERPYGGHIVPILLSQMAVSEIPKEDLERFLSGWLAMEDADLARDPGASYHTVLVARRRIGAGGRGSRRARLLSRFRSSGAAARAEQAVAAEPCDTHAGEAMGLFQRAKAGSEGPLRLHIGCGQEAMSGWINIDNQALPGVDRVLDVRKGLPFRGVSVIYAEHFLEHISFDEANSFLKDCRRALADSGVLRISTPNLDWVYLTHYPSFPSGSTQEKLRDCFQMNQAFHGWGHQFLYNRTMLEAALKAAGFANVVFQRYGVSDVPELHGIERHATSPDTPDLPHVLIAEASGRGAEEPLPADLLKNFHVVITAR
jgi:predicted SAM-dependent methyltransferase